MEDIMREGRCATCDGGIFFVAYENEDHPGKKFCSCFCQQKYSQAKEQHDQDLRLQGIATDECTCVQCLKEDVE